MAIRDPNNGVNGHSLSGCGVLPDELSLVDSLVDEMSRKQYFEQYFRSRRDNGLCHQCGRINNRYPAYVFCFKCAVKQAEMYQTGGS